MALPNNHPLTIVQVVAHTPSVGASPVAGYTRSYVRGKVTEVGVVLGGTITTADATIATTINGTAITGGSITATASSSAGGSRFSVVPTGANDVNEGDYISFAPSGASGTSIPATFYAVIRKND